MGTLATHEADIYGLLNIPLRRYYERRGGGAHEQLRAPRLGEKIRKLEVKKKMVSPPIRS